MRHVILTRLNVPITGWARNTAWVRRRIALFERYTLPSVALQTCSDFEWWVFVADDTSQVRARWNAWIDAVPQLQVSEVPDQEAMLEEVRVLLGTGPLLTTRLDADDAIADDFVERLQAAAKKAKTREILNFPDGIVLHDKTRETRVDRQLSNPFASMVEPGEGPNLTVWGATHGQLSSLGKIRQLNGIAWVQVIHGGNLSNTMRGKRVHAVPAGDRHRMRVLSD